MLDLEQGSTAFDWSENKVALKDFLGLIHACDEQQSALKQVVQLGGVGVVLSVHQWGALLDPVPTSKVFAHLGERAEDARAQRDEPEGAAEQETQIFGKILVVGPRVLDHGDDIKLASTFSGLNQIHLKHIINTIGILQNDNQSELPQPCTVDDRYPCLQQQCQLVIRWHR